jgi:hypothetical protein
MKAHKTKSNHNVWMANIKPHQGILQEVDYSLIELEHSGP